MLLVDPIYYENFSLENTSDLDFFPPLSLTVTTVRGYLVGKLNKLETISNFSSFSMTSFTLLFSCKLLITT